MRKIYSGSIPKRLAQALRQDGMTTGIRFTSTERWLEHAYEELPVFGPAVLFHAEIESIDEGSQEVKTWIVTRLKSWPFKAQEVGGASE